MNFLNKKTWCAYLSKLECNFLKIVSIPRNKPVFLRFDVDDI